MFKGFYTVATGMVSQQRKTEIITNNMANANTLDLKRISQLFVPFRTCFYQL